MTEDEAQIAKLNEQIHNLWTIASDLKSVVDAQQYGKIKYHGQIFQESDAYELFVRFLQEFERNYFERVMTFPLPARSRAMSEVLLKPLEFQRQNHCQYSSSSTEL